MRNSKPMSLVMGGEFLTKRFQYTTDPCDRPLITLQFRMLFSYAYSLLWFYVSDCGRVLTSSLSSEACSSFARVDCTLYNVLKKCKDIISTGRPSAYHIIFYSYHGCPLPYFAAQRLIAYGLLIKCLSCNADCADQSLF